MLRNGLSTFKFLNSQKERLYILFCKQVTLFWQKISSLDIKMIDVMKEINCRKNKLPIGAIESALKSLRMGGEPKLDQFRGLVRPVSQTLSRVAVQQQKIKARRIHQCLIKIRYYGCILDPDFR